ncbi:MAG: hypothetical protein P8I46_11790 [Pseudomonadales bacterium]|nr:hypothetical protein [Pseudomonadales bacterium]
MHIDEGLAQRVRETLLELADFADISERKMFGALMTMVNGHMTCGISGAKPGSKIRPRSTNEAPDTSGGLLLRVGANRYQEALADPHCRAMDFSGKTMTGFVHIDPPGLEEDADLRRCLELSLSFVLAQPPK